MKRSGASRMTILALEFSTERRSVAVQQSAAPDASGPAVSSPSAASESRNVGALTLVDQALRASGIGRDQVDCIAVGLGPGSYTGIRSAIALAQGWQLARGTKLLGVSSVECLAAQARQSKLHGKVNFVIDAQRDEFYLAAYEIGAVSAQAITPLRLVTLAAVQARERAGELIVGPEVTRWFPGGHVLFPDAAVLAELAEGRDDFVPGEQLVPIYLREAKFVKAPPPRSIP